MIPQLNQKPWSFIAYTSLQLRTINWCDDRFTKRILSETIELHAIKARNWLHRSRSNVNPIAFRGVCHGTSITIILSMFESQAWVDARSDVCVYMLIINACMDMRVRGSRKCLRGTINHTVVEYGFESKTQNGDSNLEARVYMRSLNGWISTVIITNCILFCSIMFAKLSSWIISSWNFHLFRFVDIVLSSEINFSLLPRITVFFKYLFFNIYSSLLEYSIYRAYLLFIATVHPFCFAFYFSFTISINSLTIPVT